MQWKKLLPVYFCSYELNRVLHPKMKGGGGGGLKFNIENSFISPCQCLFLTTLKSRYKFDYQLLKSF